MKRSQINTAIAHAEAMLAEYRFALPPFASWSRQDWAARHGASGEIRRAGLGWDITDFGQGRFDELGLTLFTIRNGDAANLGTGKGMVYAEKVIIVKDGQRCPMHYHFIKTEDIINRGGGVLALELVETGPDGKADTTRDVVIRARASRSPPALPMPSGPRAAMYSWARCPPSTMTRPTMRFWNRSPASPAFRKMSPRTG